jgi:hypothetical protein
MQQWLMLLLGMLGIVVSVLLVQQLVRITLKKEGFQDVEPEERMSPEVFSYNLLQSVKGPIKRLSSQLLDLNVWKERIDLAGLTPVELARRNIVGAT